MRLESSGQTEYKAGSQTNVLGSCSSEQVRIQVTTSECTTGVRRKLFKEYLRSMKKAGKVTKLSSSSHSPFWAPVKNLIDLVPYK